jgi:Tfp pilus assembly protein PilP
VPLVTYPKVDDALYRIAFTPDMFQPDPVGDKNRDPFRSYLVDEASTATLPGKAAQSVDECEKRMVADQYGLRDLSLVGIVKKGTTAYALFTDSQQFGHIARRGDCLSKDKARVKEIGQSSIIVEVRGDAPPGQPAPDPREEEWRLHPEQLELGQQARER